MMVQQPVMVQPNYYQVSPQPVVIAGQQPPIDPKVIKNHLFTTLIWHSLIDANFKLVVTSLLAFRFLLDCLFYDWTQFMNYRSAYARNWSAGFFACCDAPATFFTALFCPCVQYAQNRLDAGETEDCNGDCVDYCCNMVFCSCYFGPASKSGRARKDLRHKFHIQGDEWMDFCAHLWCSPCAMTQVCLFTIFFLLDADSTKY